MAKKKAPKHQQIPVCVTFDVEFDGQHYPNNIIRSSSWEWQNLAQFPVGATKRPVPIRLPDSQFSADQVMPDQVRATWNGPKMPMSWNESRAAGTAGTVVILESPHIDEYDPNTRRPIAPLNNQSARANFQSLLGKVLGKIAAKGVTIPHGNIVLCNPVPYQASLARLYRAPRVLPWPQIRNRVWRTLFNIPALEACFCARLVTTYRPQMVINACTSSLKPRVRRTVEGYIASSQLTARYAEVYHPSDWSKGKAHVLGRVTVSPGKKS